MVKVSAKKKSSQKISDRDSSSKTKNISRVGVLAKLKQNVQERLGDLQSRRPHRSFRRTYRRDYVRSLKLPGYIAFTRQVAALLWRNKRVFAPLVITYSVVSAILVGVASQDTYSQIQSIIDQSSKSFFIGAWGELGKAGLLLFTGITGSFMPELTEGQQILSGFLVIMTWLTTVWLLRAIFADSNPRLRDALYNAGSPILATILVGLFIILQSLPLGAALLIYSFSSSVSGVIAMTFWLAASLLALLSVYWITTSIMALVIVTLPGMYPWKAIRAAGDLVVGRRLRLLLRMLWLLLTVVLIWIFTMVPTILFNKWLISILPALKSAPIVPVALLVVTSFVTVWVSTYFYMLYRKVVDDDARPA